MQTYIYFVRHGKVDNPKDIWYGKLPGYGLSETGREQIQQTTDYLSKQNIQVLYSSPLQRAKESAEIISEKLNLPIHESDDLMEIESSLQGLPFTYLRTLHFDVFAAPGKDIVGETIEEALNRMLNFVKGVSNTNPGEHIVAISHGDPIMLVRAKVLGLPIINDSLRPGDNYLLQGEVYKVTCENGEPISLERVFRPNVGL